MNGYRFKLGFVALSILLVNACATGVLAAENLKITGPYTSGNLSLFFIHGKDQLKGEKYLTLGEALEQKKVVVHETGSVNELTIDNLSGSVVFIQSGDIVKGGRQDRTMQNDLLIPPHAMKVPIPAFCVEHGRWSRRQGEADSGFATSNDAIAGKALKLAAKRKQDQGAVWQQVAETEAKMSSVLAAPVAAPVSPTSYQLMVENKNVQNATRKIVTDLQAAAAKEPDVVGYAFAINGKVNSADVYASHELFAKLWPKLLNSSAVEAVSEVTKSVAKPATEEQVRSCLDDVAKAPKVDSYTAPKNYKILTQEDGANVIFSTTDKNSGVMVHRNYIAK